jgi:hypothetical protein
MAHAEDIYILYVLVAHTQCCVTVMLLLIVATARQHQEWRPDNLLNLCFGSLRQLNVLIVVSLSDGHVFPLQSWCGGASHVGHD